MTVSVNDFSRIITVERMAFILSNYGAEPLFQCLNATPMAPEVHHRGYVKFHLTTIPQCATITQATLRLRVNSIAYNLPQMNDTFSMYETGNDEWSESTITWSNQPEAEGGTLFSMRIADLIAGEDIDTQLPLDVVNTAFSTDKAISFVFTAFCDCDWDTDQAYVKFNAHENIDGPRLIVYYIPPPTQIADSVDEFSGTQGQDSWYYGYYDGNSAVPYSNLDFKELAQYGPHPDTPPQWYIDHSLYWTSLWYEGGHPHGLNHDTDQYVSAEHWAVRRWVSEVTGPIRITGNLAKIDETCGDGVIGYIIIDGQEFWSHDVAYNDTVGVNYSIDVDLNVGSLVDFAIAPDGTDWCDGSRFTALITWNLPDIDGDGDVDWHDVGMLVDWWITRCRMGEWCEGRDINRSGEVDLLDFAILAGAWRKTIWCPPSP
ncbi:MAG TPA: DNRLRE domain-containing protein [Sedimentisphaerales bacterium]|nr:DNRLRE domain-containing protein [Sedimentisphaerales bacterium]